MTPLICEMVKVCPDAELFHWFDASQIAPDQRINLDVVNDTPLPYSRCAIAGVDGAAKWLNGWIAPRIEATYQKPYQRRSRLDEIAQRI